MCMSARVSPAALRVTDASYAFSVFPSLSTVGVDILMSVLNILPTFWILAPVLESSAGSNYYSVSMPSNYKYCWGFSCFRFFNSASIKYSRKWFCHHPTPGLFSNVSSSFEFSERGGGDDFQLCIARFCDA